MSRTPTPDLNSFVTTAELDALIASARLEDLGSAGLDVTSESFIPQELIGEAEMVARQSGRLAGVALLDRIASAYDPTVQVDVARQDGTAVAPGESIATFHGPLRSILAIERVALNFCTHLSGVATLTAQYVEKTDGSPSRIYDTRKTLPGLRGLQKYAVACGGGHTHRIGLFDAMLIKDNHLAHVPLAELETALAEVVAKARADHPDLKFIEVEVDTLEQLQRVMGTGIDLVLLDNMTTDQLRAAVQLRDRLASSVELEASGGVSLATVEAIARCGVDRISVGALTHSAPALDLGLDIA